ncbi:hypothetical protein GQ607_006578 [Colletotrichum asianum]|uniref:Uncharacterized protein n=1 Tax=Colletotrichum asianum TaxID=702518 RepID=A0A8H3WGT9_9PEZI|nr:hypothetical protein GQ607_006578 [Colletotrichum asianum]
MGGPPAPACCCSGCWSNANRARFAAVNLRILRGRWPMPCRAPSYGCASFCMSERRFPYTKAMETTATRRRLCAMEQKHRETTMAARPTSCSSSAVPLGSPRPLRRRPHRKGGPPGFYVTVSILSRSLGKTPRHGSKRRVRFPGGRPPPSHAIGPASFWFWGAFWGGKSQENPKSKKSGVTASIAIKSPYLGVNFRVT